ncbi:MAG: ATP-binding protein [Spirochaetota bacterium]
MEDLSLHVLDIAENSIAAGADRIRIHVERDEVEGTLSIRIEDNGRGMDRRTLEACRDPFFSTKPGKRVGLGIPLLAQAARESGGSFHISSAPGEGTRIRAVFSLAHPDLKPLGDMDQTVYVLRMTHPEISIEYTTRMEDRPGG